MMCTWFGSLGGAVGCCGFLGNRESGHVLSRERGPGVGGETVPGGAKEPFRRGLVLIVHVISDQR